MNNPFYKLSTTDLINRLFMLDLHAIRYVAYIDAFPSAGLHVVCGYAFETQNEYFEYILYEMCRDDKYRIHVENRLINIFKADPLSMKIEILSELTRKFKSLRFKYMGIYDRRPQQLTETSSLEVNGKDEICLLKQKSLMDNFYSGEIAFQIEDRSWAMFSFYGKGGLQV